MKEWHTIYATRTGREGLLRVDDQPVAHGQSLGAFTQLTLPLNLYIGGVTSLNAIHHNVLANRLYHGCIQKIIINGHQLSPTTTQKQKSRQSVIKNGSNQQQNLNRKLVKQESSSQSINSLYTHSSLSPSSKTSHRISGK